MEGWTELLARDHVLDFDELSENERKELLEHLNQSHPPSLFFQQRARLQRAKASTEKTRGLLAQATQAFPRTLDESEVTPRQDALRGYAIVLTAGGEGERLRQSLQEQGIAPERLLDFTKATYPLPGFHEDFGALHVNLALIAHVSSRLGCDIPVVVTTGPEGSLTARVIPNVIERHRAFGLRNLLVLPQAERLHLSADEKIVPVRREGSVFPAVNPDETGGPLMSLKSRGVSGFSPLEELARRGVRKIMVLQGTAIYSPDLVFTIATAASGFDCMGVGIRRQRFPESDPFGTFVEIQQGDSRRVLILEQDARNETTRALKDPSGSHFLPFNTGFYAFDRELLEKNDLPDFCTPPKEILPHLPKAPKAGHAATDVMALGRNPGVLTVSPASFGVIKKAEDLVELAVLAEKLGLRAYL